MTTRPDPAVLYPDVVARGSLAEALRAEAQGRLGTSPVTPEDCTPLIFADVASTVPHREPLEIRASWSERRWSIRGKERYEDATLFDGGTDDLAELVRAAQAWRDGASLTDIRRAAPFVHLTGRCEVPDGDPGRMVEAEWQFMRRQAEELEYDWQATYQALIEAAYAEPALRALYPFTSHWALRFSGTTRPGLKIVGPSLCANGDGTYGLGRGFMTMDVGTFSTPQEAVALAVRHLPAGLGPVTRGV